MTDYPTYPKWRRVLAGFIFMVLGGFAIFQATRHVKFTNAQVEPVPLWAVIAVAVIGALFVLTGLGILFHKGFRPPGAP